MARTLQVLLATVALGLLAAPAFSSPTTQERWFAIASLVVMVCSTVALVGLAWLLP